MVNISSANNDPLELETSELLVKLISELELEEYEYTDQVVIDKNSIPHSHPILTLHARHKDEPDRLVSTYLHEQLHWWVTTNKKQVEQCISQFKIAYPNLPVGLPDGCKSEYSSYLHLIINTLEYYLLEKKIGKERADQVFNFWKEDHYKLIYKKVIEEYNTLLRMIKERSLLPAGRFQEKRIDTKITTSVV